MTRDDLVKTRRAEIRDLLFRACRHYKFSHDREASWLRSGDRCSMPTPIYSYWEAFGREAVKLKLPPPSAAEVTEFDKIMECLSWLGRFDKVVMNCVFVTCGENMSPSQAAGVLGLHRNTIRLYRDKGLDLMERRLRISKAA